MPWSKHPCWVPLTWDPRECAFIRGVEFSLSRPGRVLRAAICLVAVGFTSLGCNGQSTTPAQPPTPPTPRFAIVLDAAHGGDDTGAHLDSGQLEKSANLVLSVRLRSLLTARGFQVITTREADSSVDLDHRAEVANHARAIACISLHSSESGSGVHLFASSLAPAQSSRFTPWKTAQAAWETRSLALAGAVNSALTQAGLNVTLGRIPLPGIESMTCPAIAVELGPVRNSDGNIANESDNPDYQAKVAAALAAALLEWRSDPNRTEARQP